MRTRLFEHFCTNNLPLSMFGETDLVPNIIESEFSLPVGPVDPPWHKHWENAFLVLLRGKSTGGGGGENSLFQSTGGGKKLICGNKILAAILAPISKSQSAYMCTLNFDFRLLSIGMQVSLLRL